MQNINGQYFYIFHWQEGHITDWNNISNDECNMAGNILGRIHAIEPKNVSHKEPELSKIDWHTYVLKAKEEKSEIAAVLADNEELLIYAEKELNKARKSLPDMICLSDEDMDPKNIMWNNGEPWVLEKDITEVSQFKLPEGYSFISYTDIDRDTWIDIEISAKEFSCYEQGLEAWNRYFAARLDELPNRMFFTLERNLIQWKSDICRWMIYYQK